MEELLQQNTENWNAENFRVYLGARSVAHARKIIVEWILAAHFLGGTGEPSAPENLRAILSRFRILKISETHIKRESLEAPVRAALKARLDAVS
jgi:hypothetical protein